MPDFMVALHGAGIVRHKPRANVRIYLILLLGRDVAGHGAATRNVFCLCLDIGWPPQPIPEVGC
jgi:hypothetical protein